MIRVSTIATTALLLVTGCESYYDDRAAQELANTEAEQSIKIWRKSAYACIDRIT